MHSTKKGPLFLIVVLVLTLCFAARAHAETANPGFVESVPVYKQSSVVDVREACEVAGTSTYCPPTTNCNITIFSSNATSLPIINNQPMQRNPAFYNYTLNTSQTAELGFYQYNIACTDSSLGVNGIDSFQFEITPSGTRPSTAQGLMYVVLMILSALVFLLMVYLSIGMKASNTLDADGFAVINFRKYVKILCIGLSYIMFIWLTFLAWQVSIQFLFLSFMSTFFFMVFNFLLRVGGPLVAIILVVILIRMIIFDSKINAMTKRGLRPR